MSTNKHWPSTFRHPCIHLTFGSPLKSMLLTFVQQYSISVRIPMSAFEAAGIALTVFPIVISGLNHVVTAIHTIKRWKNYKLRLMEYANLLESASVFFLDTLDQLLSDIVQSKAELSALLRDPGGPSWHENNYEEKLRRRLDRSYIPYLKTMAKLVQALRAMCTRLGVDNAGFVC